MNTLQKNIVANYLGKIWTGGLNILLIPVYIKFLGIEAYGLVGFFASLTSVLGILDLGIGATLNREIAKFSTYENSIKNQRNLVKTLEVVYWFIASLSFVIVFFSASFISESWLNNKVLGSDSSRFSIQMMAICISLNFPVSLYLGGLMGMQKQILVNKIQVFISTFKNLGVIPVLYFIRPTIEVFFIWQVISSLLSVLVFYFSIWKLLPKEFGGGYFSVQIIKNIWRYAAAVSGGAIIGITLSQLDKVILSKTLSLEFFGYYNIASNLASSIWFIIIPFNSALFPKLVQLHAKNDLQELKQLFHKSTQFLALILFPLCLVLVFFSYQILYLWTNNLEIANNSYKIVSLLVFGILLNGIVSLPMNLAPASGWPSLITYTNLIQSIFIIPLILILVKYYGGVGAASAWVVMNSTYLFFMAPCFFKKILRAEKKKWYLVDIVLPFVVSLIFMTSVKVLTPSGLNNYGLMLWIIFSLIGSFVSIILSFYFFKIDLYSDMIKVFFKNRK